jgi:hypothetical protein
MSEPAFPPRRRWLRWVLVAAGLVVALVLGGGFYLWNISDRELREAIAEADRLDTGWRFKDLEGARAPIPDAENGALLALEVRAQMPATWLPPPAGGEAGLEDRLVHLPPPQRPSEADLKELRAELAKVAGAIALARNLADRPRGRYTVAWSEDLIGTLLTHAQELRPVNRLLTYDALSRAAGGDGEGALRSCRAALNAGRSLGDEPMAISQLVRIACSRQAQHALERTLAQGEVPSQPLEAMQRLLEEEAEEPLLLIAARSERVQFYQCLEVMRAGKFNRAAYGVKPSALGSIGDNLLDRRLARACQAPYLRYFNKVVEVVRLPPPEQQERLTELHEPSEPVPPLLGGLTRGGDWSKMPLSFHETKAELRCAAAGLAAERYRKDEGHWPESLDALVPRYLAAKPADPFDGQPLRLRRLPDGLVIYSLGTDRQDDRGNVDHQRPRAPGTDVGFRLWDVDQRGKP